MQVNSAHAPMKPMLNAPQFGKKQAPAKAPQHKAAMHKQPAADLFHKAAPKHK